MPSALKQAIALLAVLAGGCAAGPSVPPAVSLTEGAGLSPRDGIEGLDVAVDARGDVHVVWQELLDEYGQLRGTRLVYRRGSGTPLRWGPRLVVAEGALATRHPRLVAARDGVHLLAGGRLHHWWLGGTAVRDLGDLLQERDPEAGPFDAVADADGFVVLFAALQQGRRTLDLMRWTPAGPQERQELAAWDDFRTTTPRLVRDGDRWVAFWASNALVEFRDPQHGWLGTEGRSEVRMSAGPGPGSRWAAPVRVAASATDIAQMAVAGGDASRVFFAANGLYENNAGAGIPAQPLRIAGYTAGFLAGSTDTSAVAATRCGGQVAVAWVDARYRRSDRRWWNPLGGFPWGDNPDWANNDLFVATRIPREPGAAASLRPVRLTPPGSQTRDIALAVRNGQLLVLRSGRARVRKAPDDAGAPPAVLQAIVPCD